jgi:hypothetical protein
MYGPPGSVTFSGRQASIVVLRGGISEAIAQYQPCRPSLWLSSCRAVVPKCCGWHGKEPYSSRRRSFHNSNFQRVHGAGSSHNEQSWQCPELDLGQVNWIALGEIGKLK